MDYKTSQSKESYRIGNGVLQLTPLALEKVREVLEGDEDLFEFISEAVNQYAEKGTSARLDKIEQMLESLLEGKGTVKVQEVKKEEPAPSVPKVKVASGAMNVDLAKALQNMKKFT